MFSQRNIDEDHFRKTDRILVLRPIEGQKVLSNTGLVDPRLFSGGNNIHAVQNTSNMLWSFKLDQGGLAEPLKQQFKTFDSLLDFARRYFRKRNLEIVEVKD